MIYRIEAACGSNIGIVRSNNEDNFYFDNTVLPQQNFGQTTPLYIYGLREHDECMAVFDGMGGGDFGEAASYAAAARLKELLAQPRKHGNIEQYLEDISAQLNAAVCNAQTVQGSRRMGSTLAALYFQENSVYACNVGDSRIFGLRGDRLMQISLDHTDAAYMQAQGITGRRPRLTQHLGMDPGAVQIEPHIVKGSLQSGDTYLICSDGLTDMLEPARIKEILNSSGTASACVEALIHAALENGGRDNVTVIVCRILEQAKPWREENGPNTNKSPLAQLEDRKLPWGRQLWSSLRDTAADTWRRHRKSGS